LEEKKMLKVIDITSRFVGEVDLLVMMKDPDNKRNSKPFHIGYFKDYEIPEKFLERQVCTLRNENNRLCIYMIGDTSK